ncbi:hypothetical protein OESDEN_18516 [Oesophagostomum dentatum]|uniref:CC domain-containing protein n=1 Tax=Oesophagostomum dentatum TaxID=61180 RepID=A0A0B1SD20_OESDE|nr:hypothetical protein OESDEN_18516 [Oesophagostomum dentatum]
MALALVALLLLISQSIQEDETCFPPVNGICPTGNEPVKVGDKYCCKVSVGDSLFLNEKAIRCT